MDLFFCSLAISWSATGAGGEGKEPLGGSEPPELRGEGRGRGSRRAPGRWGSKGKGQVGVRSSFSDTLLAILVKFTLFPLIAA